VKGRSACALDALCEAGCGVTSAGANVRENPPTNLRTSRQKFGRKVGLKIDQKIGLKIAAMRALRRAARQHLWVVLAAALPPHTSTSAQAGWPKKACGLELAP
jgi:hypothetical protein